MSHVSSISASAEPALPSYERPPLVETATSVEFPPLPGLSSAMLGLFWDRYLRSDYVAVTDAPPIESDAARFSDDPVPRIVSVFRFGAHPGTRLLMTSADQHSLVQVQNGRLVFNWRKLEGGDYPRWDKTLPLFRQAYQKMAEFVSAQKLGPIAPAQWEVTYVNHLVRGEDWERPEDWPDLVPGVLGCPQPVAGHRLQSARGSLHFAIEPQPGRLHVELSHGLRHVGNIETQILILQLTARGPIDPATDESMIAGLSAGRSAIVRAFAAVTGAAAQRAWGKLHVA